MRSLVKCLAAAGCLCVVAAAVPKAQQPTKAPAAAPIKPAAFPPFQEATLPNGLRLLVVESRKQPVVSISLSFAAGSTYDPAGKSGLADLVAGVLTKGAGKRSADELSAAIEGVGGSLAANTGPDFLTVGADVLANDAKLAFDLLADVAMRPTFPEKEIDLLRTQTLSALQLELSAPASIASRAFAKALYGTHPYGRRPDPASVKAITRDDIVQFQKARMRPSGALLVVAGSLSLAEAQKLVAASFAGWQGAAAPVAAPAAPPARTSTELLLVHKPGAVQSNILVGNLTWKPADPRSYAATLVNKVLGGGANARLFMVLREQKSWTYGAYASLLRPRDIGHFEANTEVRTEVTDSALTELLAQLKRIGDEPIPAKEFDDAKNSLTGAFPLTIESANQVANQVATAKLLGLAPDYVQTYRQKLAAVTVVSAQAAARAAVRPNQALIVVVGDGAKVYEKLKNIAAVRIVSVDGSPLTPDDFKAKAVTLDLAMGGLVARADSFAIMVQGNPLGYQKSQLEKVDGGWKYTENVQIATFVQQSTEVRFTDRVAMQSVKQTGKAQGQETAIDVAYANGKATGKSSTPSPAGIKKIDVDAEVPAGAFDDNLLTSVVPPLLKWASGAKFTVPVFQSGKGSAVNVTMAVAGEESIKVPAGTIDAWKVDVTGVDQPVTIWVEKAPAHRVMKLALVGTPITIERVR